MNSGIINYLAELLLVLLLGYSCVVVIFSENLLFTLRFLSIWPCPLTCIIGTARTLSYIRHNQHCLAQKFLS